MLEHCIIWGWGLCEPLRCFREKNKVRLEFTLVTREEAGHLLRTLKVVIWTKM